MKQKLAVGASVFLAASLVLSACGDAPGVKGSEIKSLSSKSEVTGGEQKAPKPELQKFYDQRVSWKSCADNKLVMDMTDAALGRPVFSCAQIEVPLDYAHPGGETIKLQLVRHTRNGEVNTPLFYNPGGPGGSAISGLENMVYNSFTVKLQQKYDLVAMDPRGVGASTPVKCLTAEEIDKMRAGEEIPEGVDEVAYAQKQAAEYSQKCLDNSGDLVKYLDTNSVVADFDIARAALGQEKLNYFGYSYGTAIGALYIDTYPSKVGHMVLDSAVDPALNVEQIAGGQAEGFERSVRHFLDESAQDDKEFPFRGPDAPKNFKAWFEKVDKKPIPTNNPDRPLTGALLRSAVFSAMYSEELYQFAAEGIKEAYLENDGSVLLNLTDLVNDRRSDGTYATNSFDAFNVINNLDYVPVGSEADWRKSVEELKGKYLIVGDQFGGSSAILSGWKIPPRDTRRAVKGAGAPPVLVIGGTNDPATPYIWSVSLAKQLESAKLITVETWGHGSYSVSASSCITDAVDGYFLEDQVPATDLNCEE